MKSYRETIRSLMNENLLLGLKFPIDEGQGVGNRKPGEVYVNEEGDEIQFDSIFLIPPDELPETQSFEEYINYWKNKNNDKEIIEFPVNGSTFAVVAAFKKSDGSDKWFVFYKKNKPTNLISSISNSIFNSKTGYKYKGTATKKENIGFKPDDLLTPDKIYSPNSLVSEVMKKIKNMKTIDDANKQALIQVIDNFIHNKNTLVNIPDPELITAIRDYIGEILAPYSIVKNTSVTGDVNDLEKLLLKPYGLKLSDMNIKFSSSKNEALVDSTLVSKDNKVSIGLSSKAKSGGGNAASISTIANKIPEKPTKWKKERAKIISIIEAFNRDQLNGPIVAGHIIGVLTDLDFKILTEYIERRKSINLNDINELPKSYRKRAEELKSKLIGRDPNKSVFFFNLISGIAKLVCEKINEKDNELKLTSTILDVLNDMSVAQVYTGINKSKNSISFDSFKVTFPPNFDGKILLWPSTRYKTTSIQGKIGYKLISK